uniref:Non-specific serine/threonine protein kinase n=1 Tax=Trichobilharzia regenti TaxID=157069 RepID=A0AA85JAT8_TRIRE|nr:unnamed protein product [Trichobilharzia regenti]
MGLTNCTSGFVELIKVHLLQGAFPSCMKKLWEAYDRVKGSENDHPNIFPDDQLWVVLESAFCGVPLGDNIPSCPCARLSLLLQVGFSLAVAEQEMNFEHRDLHLGNVLVKESPVSRARNPSLSSKTSSSSSYPFPSGSVSSSSTSPKSYCKYCFHLEGVEEESNKENKEHFIIEKVNNYEYVEFRLNNQMIRVPKCGVTAYLIDFTLSRLEQDGGFVYVDLSSDTTLFQSKGDYQFDIYRRMKSHNRPTGTGQAANEARDPTNDIKEAMYRQTSRHSTKPLGRVFFTLKGTTEVFTSGWFCLRGSEL